MTVMNDLTTAEHGGSGLDQPARSLDWLRAFFSIDVETNPVDGDRIFKLGAVRSDSDASVEINTARLTALEVTRRVDAASDGAEVVVGHNLRRQTYPVSSASSRD